MKQKNTNGFRKILAGLCVFCMMFMLCFGTGAKGTSYATGFVSAKAAKLLMENPSMTPGEIREALIEKASLRGGYLPLEE